MNLSDVQTIRALLAKNGFTFKKSLGQNFLTDGSVCPSMADAACDKDTGVLEIGPGIGVLTVELSKRAKKVVAVELDERLKSVLPLTLADCPNTEVIYGDIMKLDLHALIAEKFADCKRVAVCANLPYYITSPVVMLLLESKLPIDTVTVMVQKEAAERLCAAVGTREAGAVTAAVRYYSEPEILFPVSRNAFLPPPNVDSAVIRLTVRQTPPVTPKSEEAFFKLVRSCFAQRRKTLINTVSSTAGIEKDAIRKALNLLNVSETVRGEQLNMQQLSDLSDLLFP